MKVLIVSFAPIFLTGPIVASALPPTDRAQAAIFIDNPEIPIMFVQS